MTSSYVGAPSAQINLGNHTTRNTQLICRRPSVHRSAAHALSAASRARSSVDGGGGDGDHGGDGGEGCARLSGERGRPVEKGFKVWAEWPRGRLVTMKQRGRLVIMKQRGRLVILKQRGRLVIMKQHGRLVMMKQRGGLVMMKQRGRRNC
eukprot:6186770-Pleurochrysis_carterae.AAC.4